MRAIATKEVGRERRRRTALGRLFLGVATALVLAGWGCGSGGSVTGPSGEEAALSPSVPGAASVTGTWRGAGDSLRLTWRLTQEGGGVNGTSQVASDSGWSAQEGRVVGQVSGSRFSFNDTHASGSRRRRAARPSSRAHWSSTRLRRSSRQVHPIPTTTPTTPRRRRPGRSCPASSRVAPVANPSAAW